MPSGSTATSWVVKSAITVSLFKPSAFHKAFEQYDVIHLILCFKVQKLYLRGAWVA